MVHLDGPGLSNPMGTKEGTLMLRGGGGGGAYKQPLLDYPGVSRIQNKSPVLPYVKI